jgi:zinc-binding alcohol dehydrogenase family protein
MKAVGLRKYLPIANPESLIDLEIPKPELGPHDLLVRVEAISINPVDTKVRAPKPKEETDPRVLGWDAAGVVEATGSLVTLFRPGDEVYYAGSILRPGTNSEFHLVDERIVGQKPGKLSFSEAAAFPLTTITAWEALFDRLAIDRFGADGGKSLLIIGGAGGVGSIGIQLAKLAGLRIITTASRPETREWCLKLGADQVIDHREPLKSSLAKFGIEDVCFIANFVDTDAYWAPMSQVIQPQGRICCINENKAPLELGLLKSKSACFVWEYMFTRSMFETTDMQQQHELLNEVASMVEAGVIQSTVTEIMTPINAANLRAAHAKSESGRTIGKIVLAGWN